MTEPDAGSAPKNLAPQSMEDQQWMERALELARLGVGLTSPNPTVGCVLVRDGAAVGEGYHQYATRDHAEIVALKQAGEAARGSTAYVTLEPCSHYGRTGPCARALLEAGVTRVVAATRDPNPAVSGRGFAMLEAGGVSTEAGVLAAHARTLNDAFAHFIRTHQPFVSLKIAATLDGRIAPAEQPERTSVAITGEAAHARVQELRHAHDALLTGIGTVLADDPRLTDRSERPRRRPLLRIVLDSQLRLPPDAKLLQNADDDLLVVTRSEDAERRAALEARGARVLLLEAQQEGGISLRALLDQLGQRDITSLLIEGGARLNRAALDSGLVSKLYLFEAPRYLGSRAVPMLEGEPPSLPALQRRTTEQLGDDLLLTGYYRDPWI